MRNWPIPFIKLIMMHINVGTWSDLRIFFVSHTAPHNIIALVLIYAAKNKVLMRHFSASAPFLMSAGTIQDECKPPMDNK